jgi:hypothetical protein
VKLRNVLHREKPDAAAALGVRVCIPDAEELFEEMARFSLAGIAEVRKAIRKEGAAGRARPRSRETSP